MFSRFIQARWIAALSLLLPVVATAQVTLMCVRGKSFERDREFLQTRQLKFSADGPPLGDLLQVVASRAVREKLWPELKADEIQVANFDAQLCGNEPIAELKVSYEQEDLAVILTERSRGAGDQPRLNAVARQSAARNAPAKLPPPGTVADAKRHDWLRLYFATTREPTGTAKTAEAFGKARSDKLSFGSVDVSIPADHRWANLESPSLLRLEWDPSPDRHIVLSEAFKTFTIPGWKAELALRAGAFDKSGVLLFVHGYNTTFATAAERAAQLAYDLAFPGPTVLFSWPSDGDLLWYTRDEEKARTAWRQMAKVLDQLTRLGPGVPVYVVAHSMGNRVLTQGLAELLRQRPGADKAFRQVILASPDLGEEEFRQRWIYELKSANAPRYTLYASKQDVPVALSAWLHGERRLGSGGTDIAVLAGIDSIDASAITKEWFGLSHSYFGDSETVMSDLFLIIHQGLEPNKRPRLMKAKGSQGEFWEFRR
ncbi:alpha/beta hydrolase [Paucibacter sp. Y2R2-4]|uniref:alpha/beta hydrolase n=1 Tax=Paucibacter sp. Y2R2-4 TaxID=2893553 RepID=UPI0021E37B3C|nr:alpha/beta fold hydrolase [Paucibacter sp. Y2R2-4]MCV2350806.1 alpha/beta fold hydrolase [Paucibacter sp. Y2R2-4]